MDLAYGGLRLRLRLGLRSGIKFRNFFHEPWAKLVLALDKISAVRSGYMCGHIVFKPFMIFMEITAFTKTNKPAKRNETAKTSETKRIHWNNRNKHPLTKCDKHRKNRKSTPFPLLTKHFLPPKPKHRAIFRVIGVMGWGAVVRWFRVVLLVFVSTFRGVISGMY